MELFQTGLSPIATDVRSMANKINIFAEVQINFTKQKNKK